MCSLWEGVLCVEGRSEGICVGAKLPSNSLWLETYIRDVNTCGADENMNLIQRVGN